MASCRLSQTKGAGATRLERIDAPASENLRPLRAGGEEASARAATRARRYRLRAMARSSCCFVMLDRPSIFSRLAVL